MSSREPGNVIEHVHNYISSCFRFGFPGALKGMKEWQRKRKLLRHSRFGVQGFRVLGFGVFWALHLKSKHSLVMQRYQTMDKYPLAHWVPHDSETLTPNSRS